MLTSVEVHRYGGAGSYFPGRDYGQCTECDTISPREPSPTRTTGLATSDTSTATDAISTKGVEGVAADTLEQTVADGVKVRQVGSYPGYDTPWVTPGNYRTPGEFQEKLSLPSRNTASWFREMIVSKSGLSEPDVVQPANGHIGGGIEMRILDWNRVIYSGPWIPTVSILPVLPA